MTTPGDAGATPSPPTTVDRLARMAGDIVPIELGITDGNVFTLWAPRWREGDDEWEAFLGLDEDLYAFDSVAALTAFVRTDEDNDLVEHPSWSTVRGLSADEFTPADDKRFDLIAVPELAAEAPTPEVIAELEDTLEIVRIIGEVCELMPVMKFFNGNPMLGAVTTGTRNFLGKEGAALWSRIGKLIAKHWDDIVDAIDAVVSTPDVDADAKATAEAELLAAASAEEDDEPDEDAETTETADADEDDSDDAEDEQDDELDDEDEDDRDDFWGRIGIDPVRIVTADGEYLTLRCYLGDDPLFLGKSGTIFVFGGSRALTRFLATDDEHDLTDLAVYDDLRAAATGGDLEYDVDDENIYVLPGITEDISDGPRRVDRRQLDLAVELFTDAADYAEDDTVDKALATTTPLGWFVDYALNPDPKRLAPSGPFDNESEEWRALEHDFEKRLGKKG